MIACCGNAVTLIIVQIRPIRSRAQSRVPPDRCDPQ